MTAVCSLVTRPAFTASYRERAAIHWFGAQWITLGRFLGTFAGLWILTVISGRSLEFFIGVSTVAAALLALAAPEFTPGRNMLGVVGLVTGVAETSTGIGGPPLALAYQHASGPTLRATSRCASWSVRSSPWWALG